MRQAFTSDNSPPSGDAQNSIRLPQEIPDASVFNTTGVQVGQEHDVDVGMNVLVGKWVGRQVGQDVGAAVCVGVAVGEPVGLGVCLPGHVKGLQGSQGGYVLATMAQISTSVATT